MRHVGCLALPTLLGLACAPTASNDAGTDAETGSGTSGSSSGDSDSTDSGSAETEDGGCAEIGCPCATEDACEAALECSEGICSPEGAVPVPGSDFFRGCNEEEDAACLVDEFPGGLVYVSDFFIDRTEVTQAAYQQCVDAAACSLPHDLMTCVGKHTPALTPDLPVQCIDWAQAGEFCVWRNGRLPTEAEWEKAARGEDGLTYPWGNSPAPSCELVIGDDGTEGCGTGDMMPVGSRPDGASPYGALDMLGNAAEWTQTWLGDGYMNDPGPDPEGPAGGTYRACRGGGYVWPLADLRAARRSGAKPEATSEGKGVRCAYDWP